MSVKIKDVQGLMLEKKDTFGSAVDIFRAPNLGWNRALDAQGEVEIELDIEETAKKLYDFACPTIYSYGQTPIPWEQLTRLKQVFIGHAEALQSNLGKLLKVKGK